MGGFHSIFVVLHEVTPLQRNFLSSYLLNGNSNRTVGLFSVYVT